VIARGKKAPPYVQASDSTVYLGRDAVGSILVAGRGRVTATDAAGKKLGVFATAKKAMAAILERARAVREAKR
jgi:hypothetical protein